LDHFGAFQECLRLWWPRPWRSRRVGRGGAGAGEDPYSGQRGSCKGRNSWSTWHTRESYDRRDGSTEQGAPPIEGRSHRGRTPRCAGGDASLATKSRAEEALLTPLHTAAVFGTLIVLRLDRQLISRPISFGNGDAGPLRAEVGNAGDSYGYYWMCDFGKRAGRHWHLEQKTTKTGSGSTIDVIFLVPGNI